MFIVSYTLCSLVWDVCMGKFLLRHTNNSNYSIIYTVVWCGMFVWVNSFSDILIIQIIVSSTLCNLCSLVWDVCMGKFLLRHTNNYNYSIIYTVVWCGMFVWVNSFSDILIILIKVSSTLCNLVWDVCMGKFLLRHTNNSNYSIIYTV